MPDGRRARSFCLAVAFDSRAPSVALLFLLCGGELVALERIFLEPCETGVFCVFYFTFCFALSFA